MTPREHELALRRSALLARSERLRREISETTTAIGTRLSGVEQAVSTVKWATRAPVLLAGLAVLVVTAGPAKALRLASRALVVLGLLRRILSLRDASRP